MSKDLGATRGAADAAEKSLTELLDEAMKRYEAMTLEQKEAMWQAQRESWVRANIPTGDPRWD